MSTIITTVTIDLKHVARGLDIPLPQIQAVVELLDDGNTVPFITRYRKDRTGGLDEEQIRLIQGRLSTQRLLAERKQTILRSIEAQGKLTDKLARHILGAATTKRLEDLYLPYKPKKQTLATLAKSRGLEPLAREILDADPACADLDARAADFINSDKQVPTAAEALLGAGHILAEQFSEQAELRHRLREILHRSGRLVTTKIESEDKGAKPAEAVESGMPAAQPIEAPDGSEPIEVVVMAGTVAEPIASESHWVEPILESEVLTTASDEVEAAVLADEAALPDLADEESPYEGESPVDLAQAGDRPPSFTVVTDLGLPSTTTTTEMPADLSQLPATLVDVEAPLPGAIPPVAIPRAMPPLDASGPRKRRDLKAERKLQKELARKRREEARLKAFSDYYQYSEDIKKIPPHRILAINRGEREKVVRVRIETDLDAMSKALDELLVPEGHLHADFLRGCARDALARLILPSLEREVRRELTDMAETHAVEVFAKNLRNLLLQPPVRERRILALDPGFKSGCKLVAIDAFGNVLEHSMIYLVGKPDRRAEATQRVVDFVTRHELQVIAIGNGTGCREAEEFAGGIIANELAGRGVCYVIVNEAGASVYSTSHTGREEFPQYDATVRGSISIGRRLLDPLSELVKIDPANIGVGLYQHDVKIKHLRAMLDEVVESCVNFVGADVNSSSPDLLRYVSGMNQLSARRVFEHRRQNGPFRSREQLKQVPGFGEGTYVQAAGFLKIVDGEHPLDATWIHPESYEVARQVLAKLGYALADLPNKETAAGVAEKAAQLNLDAAALEAMAKELEVGLLTLKDILAQLARPGRDPREDLPQPIFKQGVLKLEDLTPGMELTGTVLNVVDFGAFVDIGVHHSGLVHVSQLTERYVRDPHDAVAVGDVVKVWVMEVDKERRRVSLTMIPPGTVRSHGRREERPPQQQQQQQQQGEGRPERPRRPERPARPEGGGRPPQQREQRGGDRRGGRGGSGGGGGGSGGGRSDRPPRDRGYGRDQQQGPPPRPVQPPRPPKPKHPPTPLTDEMKKGKAPLRSFGDLKQFFEIKQDETKASHQPPPPAEEPKAPEPKAPEPPAAAPAPEPPVEPPPEQEKPSE